MLETLTRSLNLLQIEELKQFGSKINDLGFNFAVCNPQGELALLSQGQAFTSCADSIINNCMLILEQNSCQDTNCQAIGIDEHFIGITLKSKEQTLAVAIIDLGEKTADTDQLKQTQQNSKTVRETLSVTMSLLADKFQNNAKSDEQIELISKELSQTYEELMLLHKLGSNMNVTKQDSNFLQIACDSLTDIIEVEGISILLEKTVYDDQKQLVLVAGSGLIDLDERTKAILHGRLTDEIINGKEALLDSNVDTPFKHHWPDNIKNIIAAPLCKGNTKVSDKTGDFQDDNEIIGLIVAINRIGKPDFDGYDIKLFNSVANDCTVFVNNGRLFKELEELFIGSLKALTNSIDAKDPYTRGHSERVAFISRWLAQLIAQDQGLTKEDIYRIYLAGLLHDIGKMGIREAVLTKKGELTVQEYDHIKTHPTIGAEILKEIKQMRDILPGILYHHERPDGKGYPTGLKDGQIPLMGKIIAIADSFDAMTSKRTYRDALGLQKATDEIEKWIGLQFDEKIGSAFLNGNIQQLWNALQDNFNENYDNNSLLEYGIASVGSLIR
ncbi:HD domain-containing phosphohydrolase [Planctomycetota bacterium]